MIRKEPERKEKLTELFCPLCDLVAKLMADHGLEAQDELAYLHHLHKHHGITP
jgi:hypothetical protein